MKNLILGAAKGYDWDILEPFVASCRKNCPNAELVLFVDDISDFTRDKLIRSGAKLEIFPDDLNGVANNTRWKIFADFLSKSDDYEQIFITDTRDVIFQGDIFAEFKNFSNWLGLATEGDNIGGTRTGDRTNYEWLTDIFDAAEIDALLDRKIICDGTVIGSRREMEIFCRELWKLVDSIQKRVDFRIHDQAVANYLVYTNRLPVKNLVEIGIDGAILTAGLAGNFFIRDKKILRGEKIPAIVHQYERFNHTARLADEIYRYKNFKADKKFTDPRSTLEQTICLVYAEKIDIAAKLFIGKVISGADFSSYVKALLRLWSVAVIKKFSKPLADLEAVVQIVLKSVGNFAATDLQKICQLIGDSAAKNHFIDEEFRISLVKSLISAKEHSLAANERERYDFCVELLKIIDGRQNS